MTYYNDKGYRSNLRFKDISDESPARTDFVDGDLFIEDAILKLQVDGAIIAVSTPVVYGSDAPDSYTSDYKEFSLTGTPTGGTFTINVDGTNTAPIAYNASAAAVKAAVEAVAPAGTVVRCSFNTNTWYLDIAFPHGSAPSDTTFSGTGLTGGTTPSVEVGTNTMFVETTNYELPAGAIYVRKQGTSTTAFGGQVTLYQLVEIKDSMTGTHTRKVWI